MSNFVLEAQYVFVLEAQYVFSWVPLCNFAETMLESAIAHCRLYAMSEKVTVRLRDGQITVYEAFYDRSQDPDVRDWDEDPFGEHFDISWQKCGF